ncbi:hypothetical protein BB560_001407 [Smittium megazygosporum]|uniref:Small integral membrane protein 8 n=1 Tax=Smittium megazygosporum TaxID=133381 RepID=A0A2T9ZHL3_9FUNG|nr:hypothetical protein BB560_001407 [Smittium megazygosporum]
MKFTLPYFKKYWVKTEIYPLYAIIFGATTLAGYTAYTKLSANQIEFNRKRTDRYAVPDGADPNFAKQ